MTLEDFLVEMSRYSGERREFLLMILSGDMLPELMSMQSRFIHTQHRLEADPVTWRFGRCTVCQRVFIRTQHRPGSRPCHLAIRTLYCMSASVSYIHNTGWKQTLSPGDSDPVLYVSEWKQTLSPGDSDPVLYVSECLIVNI